MIHISSSADAKAWLAETQTDARRGDFVDARDGAISLREYVEKHWWPSQVHPAQTLESMRHRIWGQVLPQLGELALKDIGVAELRQWSADVQRAVASSTAYVAWVYLKAIMQAAVEDKRLYRNPCKGRAAARSSRRRSRSARLAPGSRIVLTLSTQRSPDLAREDRSKVTVPLLVYTGRRGAINRTTWNTKAWKPALADAGVIAPLPERQPGERPSRVWEPSREHGFHVLRHTYASVMLEAGESIVSLAKWLGHSDPAFKSAALRNRWISRTMSFKTFLV